MNNSPQRVHYKTHKIKFCNSYSEAFIVELYLSYLTIYSLQLSFTIYPEKLEISYAVTTVTTYPTT